MPIVLNAQQVIGDRIYWDEVQNSDPRLDIRTRANGTNWGDTEGTSMIIKNLTDKKLNIKLSQTITNFCGENKIRNLNFTLLPNQTIGGTSMGGYEQYDYATNCKTEKKYEGKIRSRIANLVVKLLEVREDKMNGSNKNTPDKTEVDPTGTSYYDVINNQKNNPEHRSNDQNNSDVDFWGNRNTNSTTSPRTAVFISDECSPQRLGIIGNIGADCVPLTFLSEKTIQFNSVTSDIRTDNSPDNFILSYRRTEDPLWTEKQVVNNHIKYTLAGLDPCTKYEIKIQRNCGNGARSKPTIPLIFSTACPGISQIQAVSITATDIKLRYFLQINMSSCNIKGINRRIVVEYRSQGDSKWNTVEFPSNTPLILNMLKPKTLYSIRARVIYPNNKFSVSSNFISVKTK
jgi:hypothetical protein